MRRALALAVVLGACAVAALLAVMGAGAASSDSASASTPGATASGPVGRVYYGRCPKAYYALASFRYKTPQLDFGTQDQPERFQRRVGGRWRDLGDTGGFVCQAAPRALLRLWRLQRGCD